jgi:hypothetical protein
MDLTISGPDPVSTIGEGHGGADNLDAAAHGPNPVVPGAGRGQTGSGWIQWRLGKGATSAHYYKKPQWRCARAACGPCVSHYKLMGDVLYSGVSPITYEIKQKK